MLEVHIGSLCVSYSCPVSAVEWAYPCMKSFYGWDSFYWIKLDSVMWEVAPVACIKNIIVSAGLNAVRWECEGSHSVSQRFEYVAP